MSNLDKKYEIILFFEYSWYDIKEVWEDLFIAEGKGLKILFNIDKDYIVLQSMLGLWNWNLNLEVLDNLNKLNGDSNICSYHIKENENNNEFAFVIRAIYFWFFDKKLFTNFMNNFFSDQKEGLIYILNYWELKN